ncbi:MAG: NAD(P)H-dependent glycerol-3-phosphate dehydrogenase [Kiloniellaceae bacterium]
MQKIGIIGAGAWGTALAMTARRAGRDVVIWARDAGVAETINGRRENPLYLPGAALDPAIRATSDIAEAAESDALLLVTPAQHLRGVSRNLAPCLDAGRPVVVCAKGIERETGRLMSEVLAETLPESPPAVLSGPTFAAEVARGQPAAATLAAEDADLGGGLVAALGSRSFRPYLCDDPVGAQIGGAVKNVIAIACGIVAERKLGENARAALITRGLAEIARLGRAKGARPETLMGLSGLGDLTLTCTNRLSRNYSLGEALGRGRALEAELAGRRTVAEGVFSAAAVTALAERFGIEMPISAAVDAILNRGAGIDASIEALLARPFKAESL